ncbi:hypothetical protein NLG97_g9105 [Lecanicillium saksenae]|uniref:Uncharacterized protein n=1 Tax=Lecanicillium saksenae TaxID=468837 RepID=A0ACC1QJY9_9HYPO|nr:hypothetical protein NLG97_g9105 [Lecanicillium saksenae]
MATTSENEARKDRIISHMNRDHTREMTNYLRHYNSLTKRQATNPSLRDISLDTMHIRAGGFNHEMDAVSRKSLGISDITVTTYLPPRGADWLVLFGVTFYFVSAAYLPWLVPGSTAWTILDKGFPGGAAMFRWLVKILFVPVLGIHVVECYLLDSLRLSRHNVDRFTLTWLMWQASCFLEGLPSWRRFDAHVAEKQKQKDAKKH